MLNSKSKSNNELFVIVWKNRKTEIISKKLVLNQVMFIIKMKMQDLKDRTNVKEILIMLQFS